MPGINKCMIFSASSSLWDRISIKCIIISELSPSPFPASANICNVGLMRHNELSEGIDVLDNNGNVVGSSKIAARHVRALFHFCMHDSRLKSKRHLISWKKIKLNSVFEMEHVHNVLYPQAIMETAFTRVVLPMPIFVLPPIIMSYLERFVQKYIVKTFFSC